MTDPVARKLTLKDTYRRNRDAYDDHYLRNPEMIDTDWAVSVHFRAEQLNQTVQEFLGSKREALYKMWQRQRVSHWPA